MRSTLLIGGERVEGSNRERIPVINPATEEQIAEVAAASPEDGQRAAGIAGLAQKGWAKASPRDRSEVLRATWRTLIDHTEELAELITLENGKSLVDARGEVAYAAEFFRWNAEEAVRIDGSISMAPSGDKRIIVRHPPVGVVAVVTPWNFPAAMITRKLAPALAAGNAAVVKPASETPLTALRIAELMEASGVPAGVVNVTPTTQPGAWFEAVTEHASVRMVSFTGSTSVGRILLRRCADRVLKVGMELGGNAPFLVFDDADIEAAVDGAMVAKLRHSAETCTAANRFYVQSGVADEFAERFAMEMGRVQIGSGLDPNVTCGPMITSEAAADIDGLVRRAVGDGAEVLVGGSRADRRGFFYRPTVLGSVASDAPILTQEIFGPVAPIVSFEDPDEAISMANDTEMGLAAYVYTQDLAFGLSVSERLESGMVGLNRGALSDPAAPFGGMKQSGLGREGASEGIREFCETQYIATNW